MKNFALELNDESRKNTYYAYQQFNKIDDLYSFMGYIINSSELQVCITYLEYYNTAFDTFEDYKEKIRKNNNLVATLIFGNPNNKKQHYKRYIYMTE